LEENGLLWLCGDLARKQAEKKARKNKKDEEEVEITVRAKEKEEDGKAEKEEEGKAEKRGRLCIPKTMRHRILQEAHDTPAGGYFGADRTYLRMKDRYFWKKMWRDTQCYVAGCDLCHRTNHRSRKPMGLLQPLPVAEGRWQRIGIDFITNLPVSGSSHDCIVKFVDHMTKRAHWRACRKIIDAQAFAGIFIDDIVHLHGVPHEVVSDRDVRFTADYWREVARILLTKLLMSTAFHPETDGLSENSNKTVVRYLGGIATHHQANWDDYLPLAEYAYNSSVHRSTKITPFEVDLGYEPPLLMDLIADLQRVQANESAKTLQGREFVKRLQHILGVARDELRDAQDIQTAEANKSRRPIDPAITAGVKVFLDTKDLPITYANVNHTQRKLVHRYIGPYEILRIRRNAVELVLPYDMTIHDTVNVTRLKVDRTDD